MRSFLPVALVIVIATPAGAQTLYQGPLDSSLTSTSIGTAGLENRAATNFLSANSLETPTMRRQKLARALALRDEALRLQALDGGTLSEEHVAYVQHESSRILDYSGHQLPGTLIRGK